MTPAGENSGPKDTTNLQADIDSLLKDVEQTTGRIQQHVASMPALPDEPGPADLAAQVDNLLSHEPPPDPVAAIESLDAQLAELTAQLLDNRPEPQASPQTAPLAASLPAQTANPAPTPPEHPPEPPRAQAAAPVPAAPPQPGPARGTEHAPAPPPTPAAPTTPTPAPVMHAQPEPPTEPPGSLETISAAESAALAAPLPAAPTPDAPGGPLFNVLAAISRPLAGKPASFRLMLGALGLGNIALALVAWGFVLLREPPKPVESPDFDLGADVLPRPIEPRAAEAPAKPAPSGGQSGGH
jgi:hypothetical protein